MSRVTVVLVTLVSIFVVLLAPQCASAHVLLKDRINGTGAILHVNPDDDPIAGERSSLFFDIRDPAIAQRNSSARLTIADAQGLVSIVPSDLQGSSVSANYIFPRQGLYQVKLEISKDGQLTHQFTQSQRVSRGIMGYENASSSPAWAEAGMIFSALTAVFVAIYAFNRRKEISEYSKW